MNDNWLLGFIEGEGCFMIGVVKNKNYRLGINFSPYFQISLVETDVNALIKIKNHLGFGTIQKQYLKRIRGKNHQDAYRLYVIGLNNCLKLKERLIKLKWYAKKEKDFKKWCKFLEIMENKQHLTKRGIIKVLKLRDLMNVRASRRKEYYDINKIMKIVNKQPKKICNFCSKEIPPEFGQRKYCNENCKRNYRSKKSRENYKKERKANSRKCEKCNKVIRNNNKSGYCILCYRKTPEYREHHKKYSQKPEVKERLKKYSQRPEVKEKKRKYWVGYYQKNKDEILQKIRDRYKEKK